MNTPNMGYNHNNNNNNHNNHNYNILNNHNNNNHNNHNTHNNLNNNISNLGNFLVVLDLGAKYISPTNMNIPLSLAKVRIVINSACGKIDVEEKLDKLGTLNKPIGTLKCNYNLGSVYLDIDIELTLKLSNDYIYVTEKDLSGGTGTHADNLRNAMIIEKDLTRYTFNYKQLLYQRSPLSIDCIFSEDDTTYINGIKNKNLGSYFALVFACLSNAMIATNDLVPYLNLNWGILPVFIDSTFSKAEVVMVDSTINVMRLSKDFSWVPGAILHELGHHVMFRVYNLKTPPLVFTPQNSIHEPCSYLYDDGAWSEGYASGYASVIGTILRYVESGTLNLRAWGTIPKSVNLYDFLVERYGCGMKSIQNDEGRIAAMIYDLVDNAKDSILDQEVLNLVNSKMGYPGINVHWFGDSNYMDDNASDVIPLDVALIHLLMESNFPSLKGYFDAMKTSRFISPTQLSKAQQTISYNYGPII